ncbi:MAG: 2-oxoacid:ferredoxin oxidoreductase subunit beta, partial [Erysipelotrichaceae bacterium]|nr:2-oxoacid:ferredoxin oxidoreductase subunit beta [Erysipelotrichaceae bacterium]
MPSPLVRREMRTNNLPHIWCAGCSHGTVMRALCQAIENAGLDRRKTVIVSGIGCSSRAVGYLNFATIHTTHGRALAFATGIKMANPELEVIVLTGDGDISAIGGNHLIHASRRN